MEEESKTKFSMNVEFSFAFKTGKRTGEKMIENDQGIRYNT